MDVARFNSIFIHDDGDRTSTVEIIPPRCIPYCQIQKSQPKFHKPAANSESEKMQRRYVFLKKIFLVRDKINIRQDNFFFNVHQVCPPDNVIIFC